MIAARLLGLVAPVLAVCSGCDGAEGYGIAFAAQSYLDFYLIVGFAVLEPYMQSCPSSRCADSLQCLRAGAQNTLKITNGEPTLVRHRFPPETPPAPAPAPAPALKALLAGMRACDLVRRQIATDR